MNGGWGLRSRVTVSFAVLALLLSLLLGILIYVLVRNFLVDSAESNAIDRALLDSTRVASALAGSRSDYSQILRELPVGGGGQPMLRVEGEWFSAGVVVSPADLPPSLLSVAATNGGGVQKFEVRSRPFLATAVQGSDYVYVEVLSLETLDRTLNTVGLSAAAAAAAVSLLGGAIGYQAGRRLMRPLRQLSDTADRIAQGERNVRLPDTDDPDLAPIADAFNDMSAAVEARIQREQRFAANVSHELRSPITAMLGTVDLVEPRLGDLPEREARLVGVLCGSVRRFSTVVMDLLEVTKVTAAPEVQVAEVDVRDAVADLLNTRGLVDRLVDGPAVLVFTDARHLRRVIVNLVENAGKHGGGLVGVTVAPDGVGGARIDVDDAGPGVPDEEATRLFEPFWRGSGSGGVDGAGLGLAIAREHSRAISGELSVLRSPEGGARFRLTLPSLPTANPDAAVRA